MGWTTKFRWSAIEMNKKEERVKGDGTRAMNDTQYTRRECLTLSLGRAKNHHFGTSLSPNPSALNHLHSGRAHGDERRKRTKNDLARWKHE